MNKKKISFRIEPYVQEAFIQMIIDVIIVALVVVFSVWASFPAPVCVGIILVFISAEMIFAYRVLILALLDKLKGDFVTETLEIQKFIPEFSFCGDRLGNSHIRFFYSKELGVSRYKIKAFWNGEKRKLRAVMSYKRLKNLSSLEDNKIKLLNITYLKRSKIIINVDLAEELDKKMSKKTREEILKSINYINVFI